MIEDPRPLTRLELQFSSALGGAIAPAAQPALAPNFPDLPTVRGSADVRQIRTAVSSQGIPRVSTLRSGCYSVRVRPNSAARLNWFSLVGTLRVDRIDSGDLVVSGDYYTASAGPDGWPQLAEGSGPREIPIFPRDRYFSYWCSSGPSAAGTLGGTSTLELGCLNYRIVSVPHNLWAPPEAFVLRIEEPAALEDDTNLILGQAVDPLGVMLGDLELTRVSTHFRECLIEIDSETGLMPPLEDGSGATWESTLGRAGWRARVETGVIEVPTPPSGQWTLAELHDAMLRSRSNQDLDAEWRYHVAVVRRFAGSAPLGIAYDHEATDYNNVPREGVAVSAEARLPQDPIYGRHAGELVRDAPEVYFHVALHEIGHAMGLYHNNIGPGLMRQVQQVAEEAGPTGLTDLPSEFDVSDVFRLRHLPDVYVRPGGSPWEVAGLVEDRDQAESRVAGLFLPVPRPEPEGPFELVADAVECCPPIGAPVRVDFQLRSRSSSRALVPSSLSLATPFVRGWVVGPDGTENEFRSLFKSFGSVTPIRLKAGQSVPGSLTLLRGRRGALFGRSGRHTLWLDVEWRDRGQLFRARQKLRFDIQGPESESHRRAARRLIQTPESVWYVAVGPSRAFQAGERAIDQALDTPELRRHFCYLKARACGQSYYRQSEDWKLVSELLAEQDQWQVLSQRERTRARALDTKARSISDSPRARPA